MSSFAYAASRIDLSGRAVFTTTVAASPAAAAETIIATLPKSFGGVPMATGVYLFGWAAYTVGTSGTAVTFRIRQTDASGTVVSSSGALTRAATNLAADDINGLDTAPAAGGQVYVLTMQVTAGSAASTVSAVLLGALAV